jgi:hypothetical protein
LPLSEIANARKLGTAASMTSRTDGARGPTRSFVGRIVARVIVAPGRERDAPIVVMDDLWFRVETCESVAIAASGREWPR